MLIRVTLSLFFISLLLFCNTKHSGEFLDKASSLREDFKSFFNAFKKDSTFQLSRIDKPLIVESMEYRANLEDYHIVSSTQIVNYVSFRQRDWPEKIITSTKSVSTDTIKVELQVVDTGIFIEHYFVNREKKWYLYKIINLSD